MVSDRNDILPGFVMWDLHQHHGPKRPPLQLWIRICKSILDAIHARYLISLWKSTRYCQTVSQEGRRMRGLAARLVHQHERDSEHLRKVQHQLRAAELDLPRQSHGRRVFRPFHEIPIRTHMAQHGPKLQSASSRATLFPRKASMDQVNSCDCS
jgi:hypothetical protein